MTEEEEFVDEFVNEEEDDELLANIVDEEKVESEGYVCSVHAVL